MKIKLTKNLGSDTRGYVPGNPKRGSVHDVKASHAEFLISRKLAISVEPEAPPKKEPEPKPEPPIKLVSDTQDPTEEYKPVTRRTRKKKSKQGDYKDG